MTRLELWVREAATGGVLSGRSTAIARMRGLREAGVIDEFVVNVWGRHVSPSIAEDVSGTASRIPDAVFAFERWAMANGRDLRPGFERRERSTFLDEESHQVIVLPTVCLAVYEDDELRGVYPSADGERVHTVREGLAGLRNGRADPDVHGAVSMGDGG